jgi:hypothetical protein
VCSFEMHEFGDVVGEHAVAPQSCTWVVAQVRRQAQSRLRVEMRLSLPVRHFTASTKPSACSMAWRATEGFPVRGITTMVTPRLVRSGSIVESQ